MTGWLKLTDQQRRISIDQAARIGGRKAKAIEKDWWVTLTLKALFAMSEAKYFTFKGGTSLAKCWKLIQRFSEDIDLALSPQAFEMKSENNPGSAYLSRLKKRGCEYTSTKLKAGLESSFAAMGVVPGAVEIQAASIMEGIPDKDPQTLSVNYISLYEHNSYLPDSVKIEVSVRSLRGPQAEMAVQSMLHELYPNAAYAEIPFMVASIEPQQTFLEKTFLLH